MLENVNEVVEGLGNKVTPGDEFKSELPKISDIIIMPNGRHYELTRTEVNQQLSMYVAVKLALTGLLSLCKDKGPVNRRYRSSYDIHASDDYITVDVSIDPVNYAVIEHRNPLNDYFWYKDPFAPEKGLRLSIDLTTYTGKQQQHGRCVNHRVEVPLGVYDYSYSSDKVTVMSDGYYRTNPVYRMRSSVIDDILRSLEFDEVTFSDQFKRVVDDSILVPLIEKHFVEWANKDAK